jgi:hypothetical protein
MQSPETLCAIKRDTQTSLEFHGGAPDLRLTERDAARIVTAEVKCFAVRGRLMRIRCAAAGFLCGLVFLLGSIESTISLANPVSYPAMAPLTRYLEASASDEIALARSAAPTSISANAEILTFSRAGYKTAVNGNNGFVCLVERSWATSFADPEFWNPKFRVPICHNRAAARTVLPPYIERTGWVLAAVSLSEMKARTRVELSANTLLPPEAGAMSYMMSKQTHLHDADGHWYPHLMFYLANTEAAAWGANLDGSPVLADGSTIFGQKDIAEPVTTFFVPITKWSDGTPSTKEAH